MRGEQSSLHRSPLRHGKNYGSRTGGRRSRRCGKRDRRCCGCWRRGRRDRRCYGSWRRGRFICHQRKCAKPLDFTYNPHPAELVRFAAMFDGSPIPGHNLIHLGSAFSAGGGFTVSQQYPKLHTGGVGGVLRRVSTRRVCVRINLYNLYNYEVLLFRRRAMCFRVHLHQLDVRVLWRRERWNHYLHGAVRQHHNPAFSP